MSGRAEEKRRKAQRLYEIQKGVCPYCQAEMIDPAVAYDEGVSGEPFAPTLEHVIPRSRGGVNALENLLLVHADCNQERGDGRVPTWARKAQISVWTAIKQWRRDNPGMLP